MMIGIINILAFILVLITLGYYFKVSVARVFPIVTTGLIVLLFILAFVQHLKIIDAISILITLVSLVLIILKRNIIDFHKAKESLIVGSSIFVIISLALIYFCFRYRMAIDCDELGVWAAEVKSMFFWDGYADKGKHISFLYGNYHPGQMLYEWWICHFKKDYTEGLMYVGYYSLYVIFLFPLIDKLITKKLVVLRSIIAFLGIMILPSIMMVTGVTFMAVELPMCSVFANTISIIWDISENKVSKLDYVELIAMSIMMVMLKASGIYYVIFAFIWYIVLKRAYKKFERSDFYVSICLFSGFIPYVIWTWFCRINNRINTFKSVSSTFKSPSDNIKDFILYLKIIVKSFLYQSTNIEGNARLNWTFSAIIIIVAAATVYMTCTHLIDQRKMLVFGILYSVTLCLMMVSLAYLHAFIFEEDVYLQEKHIMFTLSRYLAPLFLGMFVFMMCLLLSVTTGYGKFLISVMLSVLILMSARWDILKDYYYESREYTNVVKYFREWVISEKNGFNVFLDNPPQDSIKNILFVTSENESLDYRTLAFLLNPHPMKVVNYNSGEDEILKSIITEDVTENDYSIVYFDKMPLKLIKDEFGQDIENNVLYKIGYNNGNFEIDKYK